MGQCFNRNVETGCLYSNDICNRTICARCSQAHTLIHNIISKHFIGFYSICKLDEVVFDEIHVIKIQKYLRKCSIWNLRLEAKTNHTNKKISIFSVEMKFQIEYRVYCSQIYCSLILINDLLSFSSLTSVQCSVTATIVSSSQTSM